MNPQELKQFYSEVTTDKLEEFVNKIEGMSPDAIPILLAELKNRNAHELVDRIEFFISNPYDENITDESIDQIMLEVEERKSMGEDLESIKLDLKSRIGIHNYEKLIEKLSMSHASITDELYIKAATDVFRMKQQNLNDSQILSQLDAYGIPQNVSEKLITQSIEDKEAQAQDVYNKLLRRSRNDLVFGLLILAIGLAVTIGTLAMDSGSFMIAYGAIIFGGAKAVRGIVTKIRLKP